MPLSALRCKQAKPGEKMYRIYDQKGLYLEVHPAGGRYWRLKYRYGGKEKRLALGVYPEVSLGEARDATAEARKKLRTNIDPLLAKKAERAAAVVDSDNTFKAVARRWVTFKSREWTEGHARTVRGRLKMHINPWLGTLPISKIDKPVVAAVLNRILANGRDETARRCAQIITQIFDFAESTGVAQAYQIGKLSTMLPTPRARHYPAVTDPLELGEILRALDTYRGSFPVQCAIKLAPMLFVRPGELRKAEWSEINLDESTWLIPGAKTKGRMIHQADRPDHMVPLSRQAVEILRELHPLTGHRRYVFSLRSDDRPMSDNSMLQAFRRLDIPKEKMVGHGFRATARTLGDEVLGFRPDLLEAQLGHTVRDANGRAYNRTSFLPERRKMMQEWSDYLDTLKKGENP